MASWTAGVQKPNCKYGDITVAIQAYRFVDHLKSFHSITVLLWNLSGSRKNVTITSDIFSKYFKYFIS